MGILAYVGVYMILTPLPTQIKNGFFKTSVIFMGLSFCIVPLSCFLYRPAYGSAIEPYISVAVALTSYGSASILMMLAFISLFGKKLKRVVILYSIVSMIIFTLPLWLCINSGNMVLTETVITIEYTIFITFLLISGISIWRISHMAMNNIENYYSDDVHICTSWVGKSLWLLILLALLCAASPWFQFLPFEGRALCLIYGTGCCIYINHGYRRLLISLTDHFILQNHDIAELTQVAQDMDNKTIFTPAISHNIEHQLQEWLITKKYLNRGITIEIVAKEINTNRTYLSKYINTTYSCSFRNWITTLRIDESKNLLTTNTVPINDIAKQIGFASAESFTHIFTRNMGVSPEKWRYKH